MSYWSLHVTILISPQKEKVKCKSCQTTCNFPVMKLKQTNWTNLDDPWFVYRSVHKCVCVCCGLVCVCVAVVWCVCKCLCACVSCP